MNTPTTTTGLRYFYMGGGPGKRVAVLDDGTVQVQFIKRHFLTVPSEGVPATSMADTIRALAEGYDDAQLVVEGIDTLTVTGWSTVTDEEIIYEVTQRAKKRFPSFAYLLEG